MAPSVALGAIPSSAGSTPPPRLDVPRAAFLASVGPLFLGVSFVWLAAVFPAFPLGGGLFGVGPAGWVLLSGLVLGAAAGGIQIFLDAREGQGPRLAALWWMVGLGFGTVALAELQSRAFADPQGALRLRQVGLYGVRSLAVGLAVSGALLTWFTRSRPASKRGLAAGLVAGVLPLILLMVQSPGLPVLSQAAWIHLACLGLLAPFVDVHRRAVRMTSFVSAASALSLPLLVFALSDGLHASLRMPLEEASSRFPRPVAEERLAALLQLQLPLVMAVLLPAAFLVGYAAIRARQRIDKPRASWLFDGVLWAAILCLLVTVFAQGFAV